MIYSTFQDLKLSKLGFGTMRLPTLEEGSIDEALFAKMADYAIAHGINYFDTAAPYHGGMSEVALGKVLKKYPRDKVYIATKFPGHQIKKSYEPEAIFNEQLRKCDVDYFDFYLLHCVNESTIKTYTDPKWGLVDYFVEQKRLGRIRHFGFSFHGTTENLKDFLDYCGDKIEFCQIQLNYLDWTLQDAKAKYELLTERHIPVWVMEPVRGGKLASLSEENTQKLQTLRPDESIPSWGFRWLQMLPNVKVVLSGMSNLEQVVDNVNTFSSEKPLSEEEIKVVSEVAASLYDCIPCTSCRYCVENCPKGIDIPMLLRLFDDYRFVPNLNASIRLSMIPPEKLPEACIGCGACARACPQGIKIPEWMKKFSEEIKKMPNWEDICRQREADALKQK